MAGARFSKVMMASALGLGATVHLPNLRSASLESTDADFPPMSLDLVQRETPMAAMALQDVGEVQKRWDAMASQSKGEIDKTWAQYQNNLTMMDKSNAAVEKEIAQIAKETHDLKATEVDLRDEANKLMAANEELRASLHTLLKRSTNAQDVIRSALAGTEDPLDTTPELRVLKELKEKAQHEEMLLAHEERIEAMAVRTAALLQLDKPEVMLRSPNQVLKDMAENLGKLELEKEVTEIAFRQSFEKEFKYRKQHEQELTVDMKRMTVEHDAQVKIDGRLTEAVRRLTQTHKELLAARTTLFEFLRGVAEEPEPEASHGQVAAEAEAHKSQPAAKSWLSKIIPGAK